jgi:hypothetical protein
MTFRSGRLNTVSVCQVRASRSGRSLRYSGIEIVCPTRSAHDSIRAELRFEARTHAQTEAVVDAGVPVVEQLVYATAQQQAVVDAVNAAVLDRPDVGRLLGGPWTRVSTVKAPTMAPPWQRPY